MYDRFEFDLSFIAMHVNQGDYPTFSKLEKELKTLVEEIEFSYHYGALTYLEYNQLENSIREIIRHYVMMTR